MGTGKRNRTSSRLIAIVLTTLLVGTGLVIAPSVVAQRRHFDCLLYKSTTDGFNQSSSQVIARQQSQYGCEGWLYTKAILLKHIVYGGWGSLFLDADQNGRIGQKTANQSQWEHPIADYMLDLLKDTAEGLNTFWANRFSASQIFYSRPGWVRVTSPISTVCQLNTKRTDSYYCHQNHTIYVGQGLLEEVMKTSGGNVPPQVVLAHEWGHHIQFLLNNLDSYNTKSVEIQADCFAGVYAQNEEARGVLDPGDTESAANLMFSIGDGPNSSTLSPWFDKNAHGTGQERKTAFDVGFKQGTQGCRKLR